MAKSNSIIRVEENSIEFFTIRSNGESGVSVSGLAKLTGAPQQTVSDLVIKLESNPSGFRCPKRLKPLLGTDLTLPIALSSVEPQKPPP